MCSNNNDNDDNSTQACSTAFALVLANSRCATTGQMLTVGTISREDAAVILCSEPCRTLGQDAVDACRGVDSNVSISPPQHYYKRDPVWRNQSYSPSKFDLILHVWSSIMSSVMLVAIQMKFCSLVNKSLAILIKLTDHSSSCVTGDKLD